jgi:hypothetical protein
VECTLKFCFVVYCVSVSVTSQLKVVSVLVFSAVSVRVAWIDAPAVRTMFC